MQIVRNKLFFILVVLIFAGCSATGDSALLKSTNTAEASLFNRIGGLQVLTQIVDEFVDKVTTAPSTKRSFDGINRKTLKGTVVAHLCKLTGGSCVYEGETMLNAHRDSKITEAEFDAFVSMFRDTLNKYLNTREKNELLKILAPMKRDIVTPI